jgi:hypothetical protein
VFATHCFTSSRARRPASVIRTARNLVLAPTGDDALGGRRREPAADKLYHVADRESVRAKYAFGATESEKFQRGPAIEFGHTLAAARMTATSGPWLKTEDRGGAPGQKISCDHTVKLQDCGLCKAFDFIGFP